MEDNLSFLHVRDAYLKKDNKFKKKFTTNF